MAGKKFDLSSLMGAAGVSNLDTGRRRMEIFYVDPDLIQENEKNEQDGFTVEEDLSGLAESMQLLGLMQPISVEETGEDDYPYRLLAGHRRRRAWLLNRDKFPDEPYWREMPCVLGGQDCEELAELALIQTNTEARELGWQAKSKSAARVEAILRHLQKEGRVELPDKMRATVAKLLKTSESQLARAKFIREHLIPEAVGLNLADNVCYKLAHLPAEQQEEVCRHYLGRTWALDSSAIKQYKDNVAAGREHFAPKERETPTCYAYPIKSGVYRQCDNEAAIDRRLTDATAPDFERCSSRCCSHCNVRVECPDACDGAKKAAEKVRATPEYQLGQRIKAARERAGLTREAVFRRSALGKRLSTASTVTALENGISHNLLTVLDFADLCVLLGVSADDLLGLPPQRIGNQ